MIGKRSLTGCLAICCATIAVNILLTSGMAFGQQDFDAERKLTRGLSMGPVPRDQQVILKLQEQIRQKEPSIRIQAIKGLANIGGQVSVMILRDVVDVEKEKDKAVRIEAVKALGQIGSLPDSRIVLQVLNIPLVDPDDSVRKRTVQAYRNAGTAFASAYLGEAIRKDRSVSVRLEAVDMLKRIGTRFAIPPLSEALRDRNESVRRMAADSLGKIGMLERRVANILGAAFAEEKSTAVKLEIVGSLGMVREQAGLEYLKLAMSDRSPTIRKFATKVYSRIIAFQ